MLLCYDDEPAWAAAGQAALDGARNEGIRLTHRLHERGQYLAAAPLQLVATAKCVRVRDGVRQVTDGPFAETRETLGGYYLIDVPNLDEAIAVAAQHSGARLGSVEIRPVIEFAALP
jgi:hypothetical protein